MSYRDVVAEAAALIVRAATSLHPVLAGLATPLWRAIDGLEFLGAVRELALLTVGAVPTGAHEGCTKLGLVQLRVGARATVLLLGTVVVMAVVRMVVVVTVVLLMTVVALRVVVLLVMMLTVMTVGNIGTNAGTTDTGAIAAHRSTRIKRRDRRTRSGTRNGNSIGNSSRDSARHCTLLEQLLGGRCRVQARVSAN